MKAIGLLAGIGSLLREAGDAGYNIVGNIETRSRFKTSGWIWHSNFDSPFIHDAKVDIDEFHGADLALGHPPCGRHSNLGVVGARLEMSDEARQASKDRRAKDVGLLPQFVELVNRYQPKVFALDNLPKILKTVAPPEWWQAQLPGYQLTFLTITNHDYGNPQRRVRLWVIGSLGKKAFTFKPPSERLPGPTNAWDAISDLPWQPWKDIPELAHVHRAPGMKPHGGYWANDAERERYMLNLVDELAMGFLSLPPLYLWPYISRSGRATKKAGRSRLSMDTTSRSPTGLETLHHPVSGWTLTARERARLMGWPDDFKLWDGQIEFNPTNIMKLVHATGKGVPSEFPRYLIPQLRKHAKRI